jgi:hypothetical protein
LMQGSGHLSDRCVVVGPSHLAAASGNRRSLHRTEMVPLKRFKRFRGKAPWIPRGGVV